MTRFTVDCISFEGPLLASVLHIVEKLECSKPSTEDAEWLDEGWASWQDWLFFSALDVIYRIGSEGGYHGAEITLNVGGTTIYIDTQRQLVHGVWGSERLSWDYEDTVGLDAFMADMWKRTDSTRRADR